jgi:hypothetical protein
MEMDLKITGCNEEREASVLCVADIKYYRQQVTQSREMRWARPVSRVEMGDWKFIQNFSRKA